MKKKQNWTGRGVPDAPSTIWVCQWIWMYPVPFKTLGIKLSLITAPTQFSGQI